MQQYLTFKFNAPLPYEVKENWASNVEKSQIIRMETQQSPEITAKKSCFKHRWRRD